VIETRPSTNFPQLRTSPPGAGMAVALSRRLRYFPLIRRNLGINWINWR